jgi:transglutaminase TgpA-like protein/transglutaminase superfamily protein/uncharacterized protein DUF4129
VTSTVERRPAAGPPERPAPRPARTTGGRARRPLPWAAALSAVAAVLLAGAPVTTIVQESVWPVQAALAVVPVVAVGLALHRVGHAAVVVGQVAVLLALLTARFTDAGVLGVLPGPAALGEFSGLIARAGNQIDTSVAPVAATPEIRFLVTAAFGLLTIGVFATAVTAAAPAAAGVPLLAVFAVPAALANGLLPWWTMVCAAAGYGLLLVVGATGTTARARTGTGVAIVGVAVLVALAAGAGTGFVGTAGRFEGSGLGGSSTGSIGLSPFTALRGQLDQTAPVELFRVRGLTRPTYLRALTLRDYVPGVGWQASPPAPGTPLPGALPGESAVAGDQADVQVENVAFRDYWLPLYGQPLAVAGLPAGQWQYDAASGTGYSVRPKAEGGWQQRALLPDPTADELRAATGTAGVDPAYLDTGNVDPRVAQIAAQVTGGATGAFDKVMALENYFTGPTSQFHYDLATAPGNGDDALVEFLTVGKVGYCEQFASAMATMLRTVGVPSRVAVGFTAGTDLGDYRSISTQDAHAWVEAWFPGDGWVTFDPTPLTDGRAITPPYVEQARGEAAGQDTSSQPDELSPEEQAAPTAAPAPEPTPATPPPAAAPTDPGGLQLSFLWPVLVALLVVAVLGAPAGLRVLHRRRRLAAVHAGGAGAVAAGWAELLAESVDRGVPIPPTDTVRGAARRLVREHQLDEPAQQALRAVVTAVEASWYGGGHPAPGQLDAAVREVAAGIGTGSGLTLRQRLLPRSVLRPQRAGAPAPDREPVG